MALEYNAYGNAPRARAVRDACHARGIKFAIWFTRSGQSENDFDFTAATARQACLDVEPDGFIAEGEIPAEFPDGRPNPQAQDWFALADALNDLPIDKAVATSWAPFQTFVLSPTPENPQRRIIVPHAPYASTLIKRGWYCLPYVYPAETPTHTVAGALQYARNFTHERAPTVLAEGEGWYDVEPVLGVYGGKTLESPEFAGWRATASVSIWDAGEEF